MAGSTQGKPPWCVEVLLALVGSDFRGSLNPFPREHTAMQGDFHAEINGQGLLAEQKELVPIAPSRLGVFVSDASVREG